LHAHIVAAFTGGPDGPRPLALLLFDLDHFKEINDAFGHHRGDALLRKVSARILGLVRPNDTVARLGGDEFVVLLAEIGPSDQEVAAAAETVSKNLLAVLTQPYQLGNIVHSGTASIGITLFGGGDVPEDLLKQADLAMYKAKGSGRNVYRFYDAQMEATVEERATLERELRRGIAAGELRLHYQPQVGPAGHLVAAEALVRWNHPTKGLVPPNDFIPVAEESGLIMPLGQWVLETACEQLAAWAARPETAALKVAVNVSARQFQQADFVEQVIATLRRTGANPRRLTLELTESLLVHDVEDVIRKMHELKSQGVSFALDDFGIGYSSLYFLKRLPLDQLKIDRSFVNHVLTDPNDAAIANMIVALGQTLGIEVLAEGIETVEQRDFLSNSGCYNYQGYFFSRPLPLESFERFACEHGALRPAREAAA